MTIIASRYEVVQQLGAGGMGVVYLVRDKLRGQLVALKQVLLPDEAQRLAITREFRTLSTLRHPNVVSVLEYGAHEGQPYFTMEYLPDATLFDRCVEPKLETFIQMLHALGYLHRRGVLHRDLKPGNVLVTAGGVVKVLDFGLARNTGTGTNSASNMAGTFNYMAPELFNDEPPSIGSDLWAAGVMLCDLLTGHHPFNAATPMKLMLSVVSEMPNLDGIDPVFVPIVMRLLAKSPAERYPNALEVIQDVRAAAGIDSAKESHEHRESFLQAATFVGRDKEYETLVGALNAATNGTSQLWFIGGEAGAGKSRLLDEVRTRALVDGFTVLQGQAVEGGGSPYQAWRDPARKLVLGAPMSDLTASVLKELVPDIASLLERDVVDAPPLDPAANRDRLMAALLERLEAISPPIMLILEDVHWANESLDLLKLLLPGISALPILIIGAYRHDETPTLPDIFPTARTLLLERLSPEAIAALSASMIGAENATPELVHRLSTESEGNALFMVEVVRALAEEAGSLSNIARKSLPEKILAGGIVSVLRRRLSHVPPWAVGILQLAAVIGRRIDPALLKAANVTELDHWLHACADAAVLEPYQGEWRFSHDQLRRVLLGDLQPLELEALHQQTALAIEAVYPDDVRYAESLAQHWQVARNVEREGYYILKSAEHLIEINGNFERARHLLQRGFELNLPAIRPELLLWKGRAAERQERYAEAVANFEMALSETATPSVRAALLYGMGWVLRHQGKNAEAYELGQEALALAEANGQQQLAAHTLNLLGLVSTIQGNYTATRTFHEDGLRLARTLGNKQATAEHLGNLGLLAYFQGDYTTARLYREEALRLKQEVGYRRGIAGDFASLGYIYLAQGEHALARHSFATCIVLCQEIGVLEYAVYAGTGLTALLSQLGELEEARKIASQSLQIARATGAIALIMIAFAGIADWLNALQQYEKAAMLIGLMLQHPVAFVTSFPGFKARMETTRAGLGDEAYAAALERGKALDIHAVADELLAELTE